MPTTVPTPVPTPAPSPAPTIAPTVAVQVGGFKGIVDGTSFYGASPVQRRWLFLVSVKGGAVVHALSVIVYTFLNHHADTLHQKMNRGRFKMIVHGSLLR